MNYTIFVSVSQSQTVGELEKLICFWFDIYTKEWVWVFPYLSFDRTIEMEQKYGLKRVYGDYLSQIIPFTFSRMTYGGLLQVFKSIPDAGWDVALRIPYTFIDGGLVVTETHSGFEPAVALPSLSARVKRYLTLGITQDLEIDLVGKELLDQALAYFQETEPEQVDYKRLFLAKTALKKFFSPLEIEFFSIETVVELASLLEGLE